VLFQGAGAVFEWKAEEEVEYEKEKIRWRRDIYRKRRIDAKIAE